ncbi:MAG: TonB-dependent receptor [Bacteroidota bacterium]
MIEHMKQKYATGLLFFLLSLSFPLSAQLANRATLSGKIVDAGNGEPLIGANVAIRGTSTGTSTDLNGEYSIPNLKPGSYTLVFMYIGYSKIEYELQLSAGETLVKNVAMEWMASELEEVVVTTQAKGQLGAINQQLADNTIKNIVAGDRIKEFPDANAAESIGRLPGVSLQRSGGEGNKIVIRGLSPQYNAVEVEGVKLSGTGAGDRSVGLNVISSEMLEGIELSKSLTPDKDANAIGGVVNLRLKEAQEGFHYHLRTLGAYNGLDKSFNNYYLAGGVSNRFFDNKLGVLLNLNKEQIIRSADQFAGVYSNPEYWKKTDAEGEIIDEGYDLFTNSASVIENRQTRHRTGGSLLMDYKGENIKVKFNNFYANQRNDGVSRNHSAAFIGGTSSLYLSDLDPVEAIQSHSLSTAINFWGTELILNAAYNITRSDIEGGTYSFADETIDGVETRERKFALPSYLLEEYIDLSEVGESMLLRMDQGNANLEDKTQNYRLDWKVPYRLADNISGHIKIGGKHSIKKRNNNRDVKYIPFTGGIGMGNQPFLKGLFPEIQLGDELGYQTANGVPYVSFIDPDYEYGKILDGRYELGWTADIDFLNEVNNTYYREIPGDYWMSGFDSYRFDYQVSEQLSAAYIMTEINIGKRIMILPGVRFEKMQTEYTAHHIQINTFNLSGIEGNPKDTTTIRNNAHWFPSINMKFKLTDWADIRAAAYRSLTRPAFDHISPVVVYTEGNTVSASNPGLQPALANNYDLGFSVYTNKVGLITINGFYKEIDGLVFGMMDYNPYYRGAIREASEAFLTNLPGMDYFNSSRISSSSSMYMPVNNPNTTYFRGLEFSLQTNFWYLPGLLKGFVLDLNYSRIWSTTHYPFIQVGEEWDYSGVIPIPKRVLSLKHREGRMIDQPKDIYNASIGWDYKGFSSRLSFRYQGETMSVVDPKFDLRDAYTGDLFRMDLSLKQQITDRLSVHADFANMNRHIDDAFLKAAGYQLPTNSEYYGYTIQFGIRYNY